MRKSKLKEVDLLTIELLAYATVAIAFAVWYVSTVAK